ncbi:MAG: hypothetical protein KGD60_14865, partial [Candidatus Thorarchaeota archaeon]|nr:hypothetical protein [Candidatus Thorarchaeota archaeon]
LIPMSIQKIVESEGHGAFYSLISFSLAVLLYPQYQWLLPFISSGFVSQVDSALLILGATGAITGILYTIPLDRIIDWVIKYKVGHESYTGRLHYIPTRRENNELISFIAGVDYLTSTWRTQSWVSIEDSCEHAVSSAMNDPSIQKEIWGLKNRSAVGLAFLLWGLALHGVNPQINLISTFAGIVGIIILAGPWMLPSSTRLPRIIRQVAALRYTEDTLSNWEALGRENDRIPMMTQLKNDAKRVEILVSDMQWDRLNRLYTWIANLLEKHNKADYEVEDRSYEVWARAMVDIVTAQNKEEPIEELVAMYQSAFDVFRKCGRNKLRAWAENLTVDDLSDFPKFMTDPKTWINADAYYRDFHHEILVAFEGLTDEKTKVNWTNALVVPGANLSQGHLATFFRFACQYSGSDINTYAYDLFLNDSGFLPYEEVTIAFIDKIVSLTDSSSRDYDVNRRHIIFNIMHWIAKRTDIKKEVRNRIVYHVEKHTHITEWFEKEIGTEWKDKLLAVSGNS